MPSLNVLNGYFNVSPNLMTLSSFSGSINAKRAHPLSGPPRHLSSAAWFPHCGAFVLKVCPGVGNFFMNLIFFHFKLENAFNEINVQ